MNKSLFLLIFRRITQSFWFIPTGLFLTAILMAFILTGTDHLLGLSQRMANIEWLYASSPAGARSVLSTIAGSMITVAGVLISTMIVVLTLASQQYGPRLVKNFIEDRPSQFVIGSFAASFIYSILILRNIRSGEVNFVPQLSILFAVLSAVVCIGMMIYFIHHVSVAMQVQSIMQRVHRDLDTLVDEFFPEDLADPLKTDTSLEDATPAEERLENKTMTPILAKSPGYLQAVRTTRLMDLANEHDLVVKLNFQPGAFAIEDESICEAYAEKPLNDEASELLRNCFVFGRFPTNEQDILFPISQLEEMAIRALSPGINDPHTALECIDYLASSIRAIAMRPFPVNYRVNSEGTLRVLSPSHGFEKILRGAFQQIHHYGRDEVNVVSRIFIAFQKIGNDAKLDGARRDALASVAKELLEKSEACASCEGDRIAMRKAYQAAMEPHLLEIG